MTTTLTVSNELELNRAIASADAATSGDFDIVFATPTITEGADKPTSENPVPTPQEVAHAVEAANVVRQAVRAAFDIG